MYRSGGKNAESAEAQYAAVPQAPLPAVAADAKAGHNKGLRQFSRQVWMKVMEKRKTTYNEVSIFFFFYVVVVKNAR